MAEIKLNPKVENYIVEIDRPSVGRDDVAAADTPLL